MRERSWSIAITMLEEPTLPDAMGNVVVDLYNLRRDYGMVAIMVPHELCRVSSVLMGKHARSSSARAHDGV